MSCGLCWCSSWTWMTRSDDRPHLAALLAAQNTRSLMLMRPDHVVESLSIYVCLARLSEVDIVLAIERIDYEATFFGRRPRRRLTSLTSMVIMPARASCLTSYRLLSVMISP